MFPSICIYFSDVSLLLAVFWLFYKKNRVFEFPECKAYISYGFRFSGYPQFPHAIYIFYRRKENFMKLIWKNTFCEIERSKFNIIGSKVF